MASVQLVAGSKVKNEADLDDRTTWYQWKRVEQMARKKKRNESEKGQEDAKVCVEGTVDDALKDLEEHMPFFLEHVFAKRRQARFFDDKTEHLTKREAVIQVDFA